MKFYLEEKGDIDCSVLVCVGSYPLWVLGGFIPFNSLVIHRKSSKLQHSHTSASLSSITFGTISNIILRLLLLLLSTPITLTSHASVSIPATHTSTSTSASIAPHTNPQILQTLRSPLNFNTCQSLLTIQTTVSMHYTRNKNICQS